MPLHIQNAFTSYNATTHPNPRDRSRLFDLALKNLVSWWYQTFEINPRLQTLQTRTYAEAKADGVYTLPLDEDADLSEEKRKKMLDKIPGETIRNAQSLMKRALYMRGSRDMSAQLFVSACIALTIPARLVVSLQPLDWRIAGSTKINSDSINSPAVIDVDSDSTTSKSAIKPPKKGKAKRALPKKKGVSGINKLVKTARIAPVASHLTEHHVAQRQAAASAGGTTSASASDYTDIEFEPVASTSSPQKPATNKKTSSRAASVSAESANGTSAKSSNGTRFKQEIPSSGPMTAVQSEESETEALRHRGPAVRLRKTKSKPIDWDKSPSPGIFPLLSWIGST